MEIYVKLDCDATMFGQDQPLLIASLGKASTEEVCAIPEAFRSLEEARLHLDALTNAMYCARGELLRLAEAELRAKRDVSVLDDNQVNCLVQAGSRLVDLSQTPDLRAHLRALERSTAAWSSALTSMPTNPEHENQQARLLLELQFFVVWYSSKTWLDRTEKMRDRFENTFSHILGLIEDYLDRASQGTDTPRTSTFQLSHSVLLPLFLIVCQCRDSATRRRALSIPSRLHIQESMMDSDLLAVCLRRIVDMEEDAARRINGYPRDRPLSCKDVPEAARFLDVTLAVRDDDVGQLVCCRWATPEDEEVTLEEHDINIADIAASL